MGRTFKINDVEGLSFFREVVSPKRFQQSQFQYSARVPAGVHHLSARSKQILMLQVEFLVS